MLRMILHFLRSPSEAVPYSTMTDHILAKCGDACNAVKAGNVMHCNTCKMVWMADDAAPPPRTDAKREPAERL